MCLQDTRHLVCDLSSDSGNEKDIRSDYGRSRFQQNVWHEISSTDAEDHLLDQLTDAVTGYQATANFY